MLDGVVLARQGSFFTDLADIERIEVLRGPQSTLFGKNASAGVLSIVTKKPTFDEPEGNVELGVDEYDEIRVKGTYSAPINDDWAYRISGNYVDNGDSIIENLTEGGPDMDGGDSWGVRGKLLWDITPDIDLLMIADYTESDSPANARVLRSAGPEVIPVTEVEPGEDNREVEINDPNENEILDWGVSAELNWGLENHSITSLTAYRVWEIEDKIDIDSSGLWVPLSSYVDQGTPSFRGWVAGTKDTDQWSQELRIQSDHSGDLQYVVGAFLWGTSYDNPGSERRSVCFDILQIRPVYSSCEGDLPPATILGNTSFQQRVNVDTEYYALFGQADYLLNDSITLTLGLRYQYDYIEWDVEQGGVLVEGDRPQERYEGSGDESNTDWTGKAAIQYAFSDEANGYFSYARGYKGPGVSIGSDFEKPLEPEYVDAFELGYKTRLMDGRLSIDTALFWQEFEDTQVSYFDVEASAILADNAAETRQQGIEIDSQFAASANLLLNGSVTWLDAEYLEYQVACYTGDTDPQCAENGGKDVGGEQMAFAPDWKVVLGGRYYQPLFDTNMEGFVQLNYRWQSETQYQADQNPLTVQDSYGVFDLSFGIEDQAGQYVLTFHVRNLFDEQYANNLNAFVDATGESDNVIQFVPKAADRYFGATFRYNF